MLDGAPALRAPDVAGKLAELAAEHDHFRRLLIDEPRGSDILVGALVLPPADPANAAGVIFFNNVGYLGMCGHGTIGVAVTLAREGRLAPGRHRFETAAGVVGVTLHDGHRVSVDNVPSYRQLAGASIDVPGIGTVTGDVAYGGNWFFIVAEHGLAIDGDNVAELQAFSRRVRAALDASPLRGAGGAVIDHVELVGPPSDPARADSRNFVLCPGNAWDRSPCGTGTSAKLACLVADGHLQAGDTWRQEGITGSVFEATAVLDGERIQPTITGEAWITARTTLVVEAGDPLGPRA